MVSSMSPDVILPPKYLPLSSLRTGGLGHRNKDRAWYNTVITMTSIYIYLNCSRYTVIQSSQQAYDTVTITIPISSTVSKELAFLVPVAEQGFKGLWPTVCDVNNFQWIHVFHRHLLGTKQVPVSTSWTKSIGFFLIKLTFKISK